MSYQAIPAHNFPLSIQTGTDETPEWTVVGGLDTITPQPQTREADTTTFANAAWGTILVIGRGLTVSVSGKAMYDEDGAKDDGQAAVEALAEEVGRAARGTFRIALPAADSALEFVADVKNVTPFGGGVNDPSSWSAELHVAAAPSVVSTAEPDPGP